jgi:hypothetical protein
LRQAEAACMRATLVSACVWHGGCYQTLEQPN